MDKKFKDNNSIVKLICLVISFGLWIYISNVENPIREHRLENVPVEIMNEEILKEYKLALVPQQELYVNLNIEGPSNEIYKVKKKQFKVAINLGNYALKKGENNIPVEIISYPTNINIKNNNFLRVNVELDAYTEKTLPIESKINIEASQGAYADNTILSPTTANVSGPKVYVDKVKSLVVKGDVNDLKEETKMVLPIIPIDENGNKVEYVDVVESTADVLISVKNIKEVPIKVRTVGSPREGLALKSVEPITNKVKILGDKDILDNINSIETEPVDISQFGDNAEASTILKIPDGVSILEGEAKISVKITFSKILTKEIEIPINVTGELEGYKATLSQDKVKIRIRGFEETMTTIDNNEFKCNINISDIPAEGGNIKLEVVNPYEFIKVVEVNPAEVTVNYTKNE